MYDYDQKEAGTQTGEKDMSVAAFDAPSARSASAPMEAFDAPLQTKIAGRPLDVPAELGGRIRRSFGLDPARLNLGESEGVRAMGARAVTKGNTIAFAPGEFAPDTREGQETLGHELAHVRSQALGETPMTGGLLEEPGYEAAADRAGAAFAAGGLTASGPADAGALHGRSAPVQCAKGRMRRWMDKHMVSGAQRKLEEEYGKSPDGLAYNLLMGYKFAPLHVPDSIVKRTWLAVKRSNEKKELEADIRGRVAENPIDLDTFMNPPDEESKTARQQPQTFGLDVLFPEGPDSDSLVKIAENTERLRREMDLRQKQERLAELKRPGRVSRFFGRAKSRFSQSLDKRLSKEPQQPQQPLAPMSLSVGPEDPRIRAERENRENYPWLYQGEKDTSAAAFDAPPAWSASSWGTDAGWQMLLGSARETENGTSASRTPPPVPMPIFMGLPPFLPGPVKRSGRPLPLVPVPKGAFPESPAPETASAPAVETTNAAAEASSEPAAAAAEAPAKTEELPPLPEYSIFRLGDIIDGMLKRSNGVRRSWRGPFCNILNDLLPYAALLQHYETMKADPGHPTDGQGIWKVHAFQTHQNILQNTLGILDSKLKRSMEPGKIFGSGGVNATRLRAARDDIEKRAKYFSGAALRARRAGKQTTWGALLDEAAAYNPVIDIDQKELAKQEGGGISDIQRVGKGDSMRFFKSSQSIKSDATILEESLKKLPDGKFKETIESRFRTLTGILEKGVRIMEAEKRGEQPTETFAPGERMEDDSFWAPAGILSFLENGFINKFNVQRLEKFSLEGGGREVIRTALCNYMQPGWTPPNDDSFYQDGFQFLQIMWPDKYLAGFGSNSNAALLEGSDVTKRNVATTRLAELLGIGDLVVHSEEAVLRSGGREQAGIVMERARGSNVSGHRKEHTHRNRVITRNALRQIMCLEVLDQIAVQIDRHGDNIFTEFDKDGALTGVSGIDNDLAFGKHAAPISGKIDKNLGYGAGFLQPFFGVESAQRRVKKREITEDEQRLRDAQDVYMKKLRLKPSAVRKNDLIGRSPYIDKALAQHILALTPAIIEDAFDGLLEGYAKACLLDRIIDIQTGIKNSMEEAERKGRKYLLDPEDWDQKKMNEVLKQDKSGRAKSWYLEKVIRIYKANQVEGLPKGSKNKA